MDVSSHQRALLAGHLLLCIGVAGILLLSGCQQPSAPEAGERTDSNSRGSTKDDREDGYEEDDDDDDDGDFVGLSERADDREREGAEGNLIFREADEEDELTFSPATQLTFDPPPPEAAPASNPGPSPVANAGPSPHAAGPSPHVDPVTTPQGRAPTLFVQLGIRTYDGANNPSNPRITNDPAVVVRMTVTESPTDMLVSESSICDGGVWEPFLPEKHLIVSHGDGLKTVSAKVRNASGESPCLTKSLRLDMTPPTGSFITDTPVGLGHFIWAQQGAWKLLQSADAACATPVTFLVAGQPQGQFQGNGTHSVQFIDFAGNASTCLVQSIAPCANGKILEGLGPGAQCRYPTVHDDNSAEGGDADGGGGDDDDDGEGGDCFLAGTKILLEDGETVAIEDLVLGDRVMSYDLGTKSTTYSVVTKLYRSMEEEYFVLDDHLKVTGGHPFYVSRGTWTKARDLEVGSALFKGRLNSKQRVDEPADVYNLQVSPHHNYFVQAGPRSYLVHNKK